MSHFVPGYPTRQCLKNVLIRYFSDLYFPAFRSNTERYSVPLRIQSEYEKKGPKNSEYGHFSRSENYS